jgi:aminoacyl-tRNA hydrolase
MKFKFIIGLGNPSKEYAQTWHNVGCLYVDYLRGETPMKKTERWFTYVTRGPLALVKPATWMNESGIAVAAALRYFKTKSDAMLVAHDDADIPLGSYRLQFGRGAAGHKGVASIISRLGHRNFWRARIGIRKNAASASARARNPGKRYAAGTLVLKKIPEADVRTLYSVFEEVANETLNCIENVSP